tara:strand:+ start:253 stop:822 length:570 start_codon:yes stop_codon:yes gene_type:complete
LRPDFKLDKCLWNIERISNLFRISQNGNYLQVDDTYVSWTLSIKELDTKAIFGNNQWSVWECEEIPDFSFCNDKINNLQSKKSKIASRLTKLDERKNLLDCLNRKYKKLKNRRSLIESINEKDKIEKGYKNLSDLKSDLVKIYLNIEKEELELQQKTKEEPKNQSKGLVGTDMVYHKLDEFVKENDKHK